MPTSLLKPNDIELVFADDALSLDTAPDYKCQIQNATVTPNPTFTEVAATGCGPKVQSLDLPVPETLDLTWLQDWNAPGGGLANYCRTNAGAIKYFRYTPDGSNPDLVVEGQVELVPVALGGDMGVPSIAGPVSMAIQGTAAVTTPAPAPLTATTDTGDTVAAA
jgi:hypothetical protein